MVFRNSLDLAIKRVLVTIGLLGTGVSVIVPHDALLVFFIVWIGLMYLASALTVFFHR